jgi:hypothetical protein
MAPILSLRSRVRALLRRSALHKPPIIFDFTTGQAHRAEAGRGLLDALLSRVRRRTKPRIVKRVEGVPPEVLTQAQPKT